MTWAAILLNSFWAGLFSACFGIILTTPARLLGPSFLCGFAGRLARDVLMNYGMNQNWSTVLAALTVVLVGLTLIRRDEVSPAVLITGVLPLGASRPIFNAILGLMKVSSLTGEALAQESVLLVANLGKVVVISLAIALGIAIGMAIAGLLQGEKAEEGARS